MNGIMLQEVLPCPKCKKGPEFKTSLSMSLACKDEDCCRCVSVSECQIEKGFYNYKRDIIEKWNATIIKERIQDEIKRD